jgi:uncharacterized membrane protein (UPF0127 family)
VTTYKQVKHSESGQVLIAKAKWCTSFGEKLGFSFQRRLGENEGLVLAYGKDNRVDTSITMLFTFFDLAAIWVNGAGDVVDTVHAKTWRLSYVPQTPARYVIEGQPRLLLQVKIGDHIEFV